jgi:hypothetical protein
MSRLTTAMGNKVGLAIEELHGAEDRLAGQLLRVSDRHRADHEIFYGARDLARWSQDHLRRLAEIGRDHGVELAAEPADETTILALLRQKGSELMGRHEAPGLLLLRDLREIHRTAAGVSLDWEILAQTAQALKDEELLAVASACHPETLRQLRWSNALVKQLSPQVMAAG